MVHVLHFGKSVAFVVVVVLDGHHLSESPMAQLPAGLFYFRVSVEFGGRTKTKPTSSFKQHVMVTN